MNKVPVYMRRIIVRAIEDAIVLTVLIGATLFVGLGVSRALDWFVTLFA